MVLYVFHLRLIIYIILIARPLLEEPVVVIRRHYLLCPLGPQRDALDLH